MAKKKPEESRREFKVGEQVRVKLRKSVRLQVDYGKDETALIYDWQVEGR